MRGFSRVRPVRESSAAQVGGSHTTHQMIRSIQTTSNQRALECKLITGCFCSTAVCCTRSEGALTCGVCCVNVQNRGLKANRGHRGHSVAASVSLSERMLHLSYLRQPSISWTSTLLRLNWHKPINRLASSHIKASTAASDNEVKESLESKGLQLSNIIQTGRGVDKSCVFLRQNSRPKISLPGPCVCSTFPRGPSHLP